MKDPRPILEAFQVTLFDAAQALDRAAHNGQYMYSRGCNCFYCRCLIKDAYSLYEKCREGITLAKEGK